MIRISLKGLIEHHRVWRWWRPNILRVENVHQSLHTMTVGKCDLGADAVRDDLFHGAFVSGRGRCPYNLEISGQVTIFPQKFIVSFVDNDIGNVASTC